MAPGRDGGLDRHQRCGGDPERPATPSVVSLIPQFLALFPVMIGFCLPLPVAPEFIGYLGLAQEATAPRFTIHVGALTGLENDGTESIRSTTRALGMGEHLLSGP
jgi:hypothetical protein